MWTFLDLSTQWRKETLFCPGMKQPVQIWQGIRYEALEAVLRLRRLTQKRDEIFDQIRTMEQAALEELNKL